jgi:hypothetical protein
MNPPSANKRNNTLLILLLSIFGIAFLLYWIPPVLAGRTQTPPFAYFNELAKSFLHGRLDLPNPPSMLDLTLHGGKWYVPFPPLAALLMTPWVAIFGGLNTVLFAAVVGAVNVALVFLLLQAFAAQRWISLSPSDGLWLTALFAFGTVLWYMSTQGSVWFVAQVCTVTFVALAVFLAVYYNAPLAAGVALGLAMLGRPNLVLTYPLLFGIGIQHCLEEDTPDKRKYLLRWIILSGLPLALAAVSLLIYNGLRFGNLFDFGYATANVDPRVATNLKTYGQFNVSYIWRNIKVLLFSIPIWNAARNRITPSGEGMSILLTTPAFLYIFKSLRKSPILIGAWISLGLLLLPLITYFNTGWYQFGYRFSLDFIIPLFVLLAFGLGNKMSRGFKILIIASILMNLWGTAWFLNLF